MKPSKVDRSDWTVEDYIEDVRHRGATTRIMDRLKLNTIVTTMVYYDLPWMRDFELSDGLDALDVQGALVELGPNPVLNRKYEEKGVCSDCGGYGSNHYLTCHVWSFNNEK